MNPNPIPIPHQIIDVPTLSEWGLIAMVCVLGIVGIISLHKRVSSHS